MCLVMYSTKEVMGKILVEEFVTDKSKTTVQAVLDQALHCKENANFQTPFMTKGGGWLKVLLNATRRRNKQGNIIGVVGIGQDITSCLAQEHGYSCLIDKANAPIFGVDTFRCINGRNKCASHLIGCSIKAVMGQSQVQECATD
jgi:PAS domain S-box-containing protein